MKTLKLFLIVFTILIFSSCSQKTADIKGLYNSGEAFKIGFSSWESFDQSAITGADRQTPGVRFFYSKKTNIAVVSFDDGRIGEYEEVKYNKIQSDDTQVCLQNDDTRFVIMNNGERYSLKMFDRNLIEWHDIAYFKDGKSIQVDTDDLEGPAGGFNISFILLGILIGLMIWGIVKKKIWAIIIPSILLSVVTIIVLMYSFEGKKTSSAITENKTETKVAVDSLWSATSEGYMVVYERPDGGSAEIGKIYNDDKSIYPVYYVEGPWYEIGFHGGIGYVYERDCILQSGMGDI